jgi:hypothetical protein
VEARAVISIRFVKTGIVDAPMALPPKLERALDVQFEACARVLLAAVTGATPVGVSGDLRRGWYIDRPKPAQRVVANEVEYLLPTELGRRASPCPIAPLSLWVQRKLQIPPPAADHVAFLIARKKAQQDTPGQFFVKKTVDLLFPQFSEQVAGAVKLALESD